MGRDLTTEEFITRARKVHNNFYDYSQVVYVPGINKKVKIICEIHGLFLQNPHNHLQDQGCPKCGTDRTKNSTIKFISKDDFIINAKKIHGDTYDYSKVDQIIYGSKKIKIICKRHGEFLQPTWNHLRGAICFKCSRELIGKSLRKGQDQFIKDARLKHGNKYDYSKTVYVKNSEKVIIICKKHGEFLQTPMVHLQGNGNGIGCGCPECNNSHGINRIIRWLKNKNIKLKREKVFKECINIHPLRFDIYLPEKNTCIEYDGQQHFRPISIFGGEKVFKIIKKNDEIKNDYCKNNNIILIRISYKFFNSIEKILEKELL